MNVSETSPRRRCHPTGTERYGTVRKPSRENAKTTHTLRVLDGGQNVDEIETARLVNLLIGTWPTGPRGYVWRDVVKPLDRGLALGTYAELRDANERMTVAEFVSAYKRHEQRRDEMTAPPRVVIDPPDVIAFDDYMLRLQRRADAGSTEAQAELAAWRRHTKHGPVA